LRFAIQIASKISIERKQEKQLVLAMKSKDGDEDVFTIHVRQLHS
jgi:hypothetical protein